MFLACCASHQLFSRLRRINELRAAKGALGLRTALSGAMVAIDPKRAKTARGRRALEKMVLRPDHEKGGELDASILCDCLRGSLICKDFTVINSVLELLVWLDDEHGDDEEGSPSAVYRSLSGPQRANSARRAAPREPGREARWSQAPEARGRRPAGTWRRRLAGRGRRGRRVHARGRGRPRQCRCYARGRAETPEAGGPQGRRAPLARAALRHTVSFYASRAGAALVVGIMNRVWLSCVDERAIALPRGRQPTIALP